MASDWIINVKSHLVLVGLVGHEVPVGQGDGPQAVLGHGLDHVLK